MNKKLLTPTQVAEMTGIQTWRIYQLLRDGEIPHLKIGSTYRISEEALVRWIEEKQGEAEVREGPGS